MRRRKEDSSALRATILESNNGSPPPASKPTAPNAPTPLAVPPPGVFQSAANASVNKASQSPFQTLVLSFLAGALIGIGGLLMTCVGMQNPALASANPGLAAVAKGAIGLPAGLAMVILTGAELFTGNIFVMFTGFLERKVCLSSLARNWTLSFAGNLAGSVFMACAAAAANTLATGGSAAGAAMALAQAKVAAPFSVLFVRGVLCNWLVCLAVWMAMASNTVSGKILSVLIPITTFVSLGFEHSIANMYLIPQGMLAGAQITAHQFFAGNLLPVTLGNVVGGAIFVALAHFVAYGRK